MRRTALTTTPMTSVTRAATPRSVDGTDWIAQGRFQKTLPMGSWF